MKGSVCPLCGDFYSGLECGPCKPAEESPWFLSRPVWQEEYVGAGGGGGTGGAYTVTKVDHANGIVTIEPLDSSPDSSVQSKNTMEDS